MKKSGFTLIELSIVLIIIGLIVGGVLVGRNLIGAAAVRSQISQIQEYDTAYNTFKIKYDCVPGDCKNITQFLGTTDSFGNAINNGDSNGAIETNTRADFDTSPFGSFWSASGEVYGAIQQLSVAKLITFSPKTPTSYLTGVGLPPIKLSPSSGLFFVKNYGFIYSSYPTNSFATITNILSANSLVFGLCALTDQMENANNDCAIFSPADLQAIDTKIDDAKPLTGKFLGYGGYGNPDDCLSNPTSQTNASYKTIKSPQCQATYLIN